MSKPDNSPSWDDMTDVTSGNDSDMYKLDPGEKLIGQLRHLEQGVGQYDNTVLHLTTDTGEHISMWSNTTITNALEQADAQPGDWIGLQKDEETFEYETEDGTGEAYGFEVRVVGDREGQ